MFEKMRRNEKELSKEETYQVLDQCDYGILSIMDQDGYPFSIPLHVGRRENCLYFHGALEGKKAESFSKEGKCSFTAIRDYIIYPEKFDTHYTCVMVFGKIKKIIDDQEKKDGLLCLLEKYSPDDIKEGLKYMERSITKTAVYKIVIEEITGKVGS